MRSFIVSTSLLVLVACDATRSRTTPAPPLAGETLFVADAPSGWIASPFTRDGLEATRDGTEVQRIAVANVAAERAFPLTKRAAAPNATPSELAELAMAEMKALGTSFGTQLEVVSTEPATIAGNKGFRASLVHTSVDGLVMKHLYAGFVNGKTYTSAWFYAPELHYYERDLPAFETTLASLRAETPKPR